MDTIQVQNFEIGSNHVVAFFDGWELDSKFDFAKEKSLVQKSETPTFDSTLTLFLKNKLTTTNV